MKNAPFKSSTWKGRERGRRAKNELRSRFGYVGRAARSNVIAL